jgi:hypothetical protein
MPRTRRDSFSGNDLNAWCNHADYLDEMAESEARDAADDALEAAFTGTLATAESEAATYWWRLANPELAAERDALDAEHEALWDAYWVGRDCRMLVAERLDDWQARMEAWTERADAALKVAMVWAQERADAKAARHAAWLTAKAAAKTRRRVRVKGLGGGKGLWSGL